MELFGITVLILMICLFMKVPVFISVLAASMSYFILGSDVPSMIFAQRMTSGVENVTLLAIPFFIALGVYMNLTGVTERIMNFAKIITGRMAGGLAQVNILVSTLMGGMSGSSLADAAMDSKMLVPEMERNGFSRPYSAVVTAFSSTITPLIPPGIGMILYGSIANVSIGKLFVSGLGIGSLLCIVMMILNSFISKKRGYVAIRDKKVELKVFMSALKDAFFPLCLPIIIIGGIRIGIFTATEAGAAGIVYALILGIFYKELTFAKFIQGIKETVEATASIMVIVGAASTFAWILTRERVPQELMAFVVENIHNKYIFLIIVNLLLLIVGMFIEGNAAMIILVPLLAPIAASYGINEIQFAMMFIFNMAIGGISPPMGTIMFVTCGLTKCKIKDFLKESIPYFILMLFVLVLLTFFTPFSTILVDLVF